MQKDEVIRARVSPELKQQAESLAESKGLSLSEYLRFLLMNEIDQNKKETMKIMEYSVLITMQGTTMESIGGLTEKEAIELAKEKKLDLDGHAVYVQWFRASDGQKGYLNPDGNSSITGEAW